MPGYRCRPAGWLAAGGSCACGRWLHCLHINDNHGQADEHLLPFDGDCDWSGFVSALREVGYRGALNLEVADEPYKDKYDSPGEMIEEGIRRVEALHGL